MSDHSIRNSAEQKYEVTPLELFFDLVFAISQLSQHLLTHLSWRGAAETLVLLLAGGPILFLAAQGWYLWVVPKVRLQLHVIGGIALLLVGLVTLAAPPYLALLLVSASISIFAILAR